MAYYYLHENNRLIFKTVSNKLDLIDSSFVKYFWEIPSATTISRELAWQIVCEALALGARLDETLLLAEKWELNTNDGFKFAENRAILLREADLLIEEEMKVEKLFIAAKLDFEGPTEPHGVGRSVLEAIVKLLVNLNFKERSAKNSGVTMFHLIMELGEPLTCYQCEGVTKYLFDDSRCKNCTRMTVDEVTGGAV